MKIVKRLTFLAAICLVLPACSSNITRFDAPVMGMSEVPLEKRRLGRDQRADRYAANDYRNDYNQQKYQNSYDRNGYQPQRREVYRPDYVKDAKRSYDKQYKPQDELQKRYIERDVYDTASTDNAYQRKQSYQTKRYDRTPYNRRDSYDQGGVRRDQLPDLSAQKRAPDERYGRAPEKQSYARKDYAANKDYAVNTVQRDAQGRHIVGQGDTLYNISRRYNVTTEQIRDANEMQSNDIKLGQRLYIPGYSKGALPKLEKTTAALGYGKKNGRHQRHRVVKGDTLYNISRRYNVSRQELAEANGLTDLGQVKLGQDLIIPGKGKQDSSVRVASIDKKAGLDAIQRQEVPAPHKKPIHKSRHKIKSVDSGARAKLASRHNFIWPANGRILAGFGRQKSGIINDGVNLALPLGTNVKAAEAGVVAYAGSELKGYGNLILIRHNNNWVTAYAHNSKLLVKRGQKVKRGQAIAKSGKSGTVHQPQLHFELRKGSKPVNPMKYLAMR